MNSYPDYKRGRPLPLGDLQRVDEAATAALRGEIGHDAGPGAVEDTDPQGRTLNLWARPRVWAKVTGASTSGPGGLACYPWEECLYDDSAWVAVGGGRSGTGADNPIKESNDNSAVPSGAVVSAELHESGLYWLFSYEPSTGATTITVREVDGTPTLTGIHTVELDQADGFVLSNPSAGVARIDLVPPTSAALTVREVDGAPSVGDVTVLEFDQADGLIVSAAGANRARVDLALTVLFPPPYYVIIPPTSPGGPPLVQPTVKYETYFHNAGDWYFGGEPHNASRVHFFAGLATPNKDRYYAVPYLEALGGTLDGIACWVGALGTNAQVRLGIYTNYDDRILQPYQLVLDAGVIDASLATGTVGLKVLPLNFTLPPNALYWLVMVVTWDSPNAPQIKVIDRDYCWNLLGNDDAWGDTDAQGGWYADSAFAALPALFPALSGLITQVGAVADHLPAIGLRYSSAERILRGGGRDGGGVAVMGAGQAAAFAGRVVRGGGALVGGATEA